MTGRDMLIVCLGSERKDGERAEQEERGRGKLCKREELKRTKTAGVPLTIYSGVGVRIDFDQCTSMYREFATFYLTRCRDRNTRSKILVRRHVLLSSTGTLHSSTSDRAHLSAKR